MTENPSRKHATERKHALIEIYTVANRFKVDSFKNSLLFNTG